MNTLVAGQGTIEGPRRRHNHRAVALRRENNVGNGTRALHEAHSREEAASPESIAPPAPGFRSISGVVLEKTDAGTQPVAGAYVAYEWFEDISAAYTFSDAAGRYLLCSVPDGETVPICVEDINGFLWCVWVPAGQSTGADITLP